MGNTFQGCPRQRVDEDLASCAGKDPRLLRGRESPARPKGGESPKPPRPLTVRPPGSLPRHDLGSVAVAAPPALHGSFLHVTSSLTRTAASPATA